MATPDFILQGSLTLAPGEESRFQQQMARIGKTMPWVAGASQVRNFSAEMERANQRVISLGASFAVLAASVRTFKGIVTSTIEVEKALTDINVVLKLSSQNFEKFGRDLFGIAQGTSQAFSKVADAAREFSRQGLSVSETLKRTKDAMILTRLASLDTSEAVDTLTATLNGFHKAALDSTQIVNKLATVDAAFAVSSRDLAEGLARTGSAAADAGVSFDELIGLITAAQQTTARGGAVIGNSLKTIFTRIERRDTIDAIESLGLAVRDAEGAVLPAIQVLKNFASSYDNLGNSVKKQAAELVGGVFQINILKALLGDLSNANGAFARSQDVAKNATDEAIKRNLLLNQTLAAQLDQLKAVGTQVGANIGKGFTPPVKSLIGTIINNPVTDALRNAGDPDTAGGEFAEKFLRGFGNAVVSTLGPLLVYGIGKIFQGTLSKVFRDFKDITGLNAQANRQAAIQERVVALYNSGDAALKAQILDMTRLVRTAGELEVIMRRALLANSKVESGLIRVSSQIATGSTLDPRGRRAAEGYIPFAEESRAISAGVGGAPSGARPVLLPNFNFGGGKSGPIVANSSEYMVNMAGGSAIYNQDMVQKYGLPPGSKPIAAGGYIPTAAYGLPSSYSDPAYYQSLGNPSGPFGPPAVPRKLMSALGGLSSSTSIEGASKFADEIERLSKNLDKITQKGVLRQVSSEFSRIAAAAGPVGRYMQDGSVPGAYYGGGAGAASADDMAAYEARRAATAGQAGPLALPQWRNRPVASGPSLFSKIKGFANKNPVGLGLGLSLGAGFAGGFIDEGEGGTGEGILRGAAKSGLSLAGTGAGIGSLFGPLGTLIGGGAGLAVGGVYGGFRKAHKSPEDIARQIENENAAAQQRQVAVSESIRLRDSLFGAGSDVTDQSRQSLRTQLQQSLNAINDPTIRSAILGNTSEGDKRALDSVTSDQGIRDTRQVFQSGFGRIGGKFKGLYGSPSTPKDQDELTNQFIAGLSRATPQQLDALEALVSKDNLSGFKGAARLSGLGQGDIDDLIDGLTSRSPITGGEQFNNSVNVLTNQSLLGAIGKLRGGGVAQDILSGEGSARQAAKKSELSKFELLSSASGLESAAKLLGISSDTSSQFASLSQKNLLENGGLTSRGQILAGSAFDLSSTSTKFAADRQQTLLTGRAGLLRGLAGSGERGTEIAAQVKGASSVGDLQALASTIQAGKSVFDPDGKLLESIQEMITSLQALDATEQGQTAVLEESGRLTLEALDRKGTRGYSIGQVDQSSAQISEDLARLTGSGGTRSAKDALERVLSRNGIERRRLLGGLSDVDAGVQGGVSDSGFDVRDSNENLQIKLSLLKDAEYVQNKLTLAVNEEKGSLADQIAVLKQKNTIERQTQDQYIDFLREQERYNRTSSRASGSDLRSSIINRSFGEGETGTASLKTGFGAVFEGIGKDMGKLQELGARLGDSLTSNLGNAFGDFVTGAKSAKDAFRDFATGVLNEAARMLASQAVASLLGFVIGKFIPGGAGAGAGAGFTPMATTAGFGQANGGPIGFANGGGVPAMVMGGEYIFGPQAARKIGYGQLDKLNRFAAGGFVTGGSGVRDDVPAVLPQGSFVIRKSSAMKLGGAVLNGLANGGPALHMQHFADGGMATGGGGPAQVSVMININNNGSTTSSSNANGDGAFGKDFAGKLENQMRALVNDELVRQSQPDGFFAQRRRFTS